MGKVSHETIEVRVSRKKDSVCMTFSEGVKMVLLSADDAEEIGYQLVSKAESIRRIRERKGQ